MEQTLENGIADNLLHNIFNDLSVGLELYDKDGLMIDVNYSLMKSKNRSEKEKQCVSWQNIILMTCVIFFLLICPV